MTGIKLNVGREAIYRSNKICYVMEANFDATLKVYENFLNSETLYLVY